MLISSFVWHLASMIRKYHNHKLQSLKTVLILPNSTDPDEMQHHAAFHLGLYCLPKYPFRGLQYKVPFILFFTSLLTGSQLQVNKVLTTSQLPV